MYKFLSYVPAIRNNLHLRRCATSFICELMVLIIYNNGMCFLNKTLYDLEVKTPGKTARDYSGRCHYSHVIICEDSQRGTLYSEKIN